MSETRMAIKTAASVATLLVFVAQLSTGMYVPLAPFLATRRQVGYLLSAQGLSSFLALVPAGQAVDRFSAKPVIEKGILIFGLGLVFSLSSTTFWVQLAGRLCGGAGASILFNAAMSLVMERCAEKDRGPYIGQVLGIGTLGTLVGPPLAGYTFTLASAWRVPNAEVAPLLLPLALVAVARCALRSVADVEARLKEERLLPLDPVIPKKDSLSERFLGVYTNVGAKSGGVAADLAILFGAQSAILCAGTLDMRHQGLPPTLIGLAPVPAGIMQAVTSHYGGVLSAAPWRRGAMMMICPAVLAVSLGALCAARPFLDAADVVTPFVVAMGLVTAALGLADAPSIDLMTDLAKQHNRGYGEAVTATELAVCAGQAVGPSLGVLILDFAGFNALCLVLAAIAAAAGAANVALFWDSVRAGDRSHPPAAREQGC